MSAEPSISSIVPFLVAALARSEGAKLPTLAVGSAPPRAEEHVEVANYFEVWRAIATELADAEFPLRAATAFQLEDHELFGFLAMSCKTLGEAYRATARYRALYCNGARWELELSETSTRLIWYPWPGDVRDPGYRAAMDFAVADMETDIRRLASSGPRPRAVRLAHAAPTSADGFRQFYGVEPQFGAPLYELIYAAGLQDLPIVSFNSRLKDYFDAECERLLSKVVASDRTQDLLRQQLVSAMDGGDTSIETVAKRMGQSSRSLQRRLAEEGTRYNDVLAEIRSEFAKRYLARGTLSASEVAYLLGFTEPPAFFKAFKRWTGLTPGEFQQGAVT